MSTDARRNSLTAVCFLIALAAAVIYLCLGALPQAGGFLGLRLPARSPKKPLHKIETQVKTADAPEKKEKVLPDHPLVQRTLHSNVPIRPTLDGEALAESLVTRTQEDPAEETLIDLLDRDHTFIEVYGGAQRLALRGVVEDQADKKYTVVKLTDQVLTFADLEPEQEDMTTRAKELSNFARRVKRRYDIPVLYVQAPSKTDMAQLPAGVEDVHDAEADQFLKLLKEAGAVDTVDLRPAFREVAEKDPETIEELFFHTDHHWTPAGAFLGYQTLCESLQKKLPYRKYFRKLDETLTDEEAFTRYSFDQVFLGSQGKRVGSQYIGVDGIEVWAPKFSTSFTHIVNETSTREGPFYVSLLYPELLANTGLYETNPYVIWSGGDHLLSRAINHKNPDGPHILILRDSYGCAFTPFLALACSELDAMDPRNFNGDMAAMLDYIDWLDPDMILVMNTTGSLTVDGLYPYLPTARANTLAEEKAKKAEADAKWTEEHKRTDKTANKAAKQAEN